MIIRRPRKSVGVLSPNYLGVIGFAILLAVVLVGGGTLLMTGCTPADEKEKSKDKDEKGSDMVEIDESKLIKTPSGLQYQDIKVGEGPDAKVGDTAVVHYTGWLKDGKKFDSSVDKNKPYPVTLGQGRVIQGWEIGLRGMKAGGKRVLVIPPELGYGAEGYPGVIPPNSTLVFEVELMEIR